MSIRRLVTVVSLLVAVLVSLAPRPAAAGWACAVAARWGGACDVCNGACEIEVFFDALGGW